MNMLLNSQHKVKVFETKSEISNFAIIIDIVYALSYTCVEGS